MSGLQFGLIKKKTGPVLAKPRQPSSRPMGGLAAFGDNSSDEDNLDEDKPTTPAKKGSTSRLPPPSMSDSPPPISSATTSATSAVNKSLRSYAVSTLESTSVIELQNEALAQDATVFDYDGVYDQLKAGDRARELARKQESAERKPKYIHALLEAAETRKRDRQIADEKRIEREREREGEEFKDKEQFITPAYKAQKEAMRLAEEEDRKKEEELAKDKDGSLMAGFYRNLLNERSKMRTQDADSLTPQQLAAASKELEALEEEKRLKAQADQELLKDARERGLKVAVNEEGEIVDKVELLQGGLNVRKKPTASTADSDKYRSSSSSSRSRDDRSSSSRYDRERAYADYKNSKSRGGRGGSRHEDELSSDQRSRMTEQIERQLLEQEKQREEKEKVRQESIRESLKRKNQDDQVMDAKARYLARKAAAAAAKKDT